MARFTSTITRKPCAQSAIILITWGGEACGKRITFSFIVYIITSLHSNIQDLQSCESVLAAKVCVKMQIQVEVVMLSLTLYRSTRKTIEQLYHYFIFYYQTAKAHNNKTIHKTAFLVPCI